MEEKYLITRHWNARHLKSVCWTGNTLIKFQTIIWKDRKPKTIPATRLNVHLVLKLYQSGSDPSSQQSWYFERFSPVPEEFWYSMLDLVMLLRRWSRVLMSYIFINNGNNASEEMRMRSWVIWEQSCCSLASKGASWGGSGVLLGRLLAAWTGAEPGADPELAGGTL